MDCMYTLAYRCPRPTENVPHKKHQLLFLCWVGLDAIHSIKCEFCVGDAFGEVRFLKYLCVRLLFHTHPASRFLAHEKECFGGIRPISCACECACVC